MPISPIQSQFIPSLQETGSVQKVGSAGSTAGTSSAKEVGQTFEDVLSSLSSSESQSDNLMQKLAGGGNVELHDVMISAEETDLNFKVVMAIRDKLVDAYREVMRMSI